MVSIYTNDEYKCLRKEYMCTVNYCGLTFKNVEAAWQAQKCMYEHYKRKFTRLSAEEAVKESKDVDVRYDWNDVKYSELVRILLARFNNDSSSARVIMSTGRDLIVADKKNKKNTMFAKALMEVRKLL